MMKEYADALLNYIDISLRPNREVLEAVAAGMRSVIV